MLQPSLSSPEHPSMKWRLERMLAYPDRIEELTELTGVLIE